jgi:SAM-dependent methyltransferase
VTRMTAIDQRTQERLHERYLVEKELAARLRHANKEERRRLYSEVYDELFRRVPDHPQLALKQKHPDRGEVRFALGLLKKFLAPDTAYLEIGPGDCALACEVAKLVKHVYAVDVSAEVTRDLALPANFSLEISDGSSVPVAANSIDLAFSDQLMEHLHPDDALEQVRNIYAVLKPGGAYVCITPNRLAGPHDVSKYFDRVATGFHLHEYTVTELSNLFRAAGFSRFKALAGARGHFLAAPTFAFKWTETLLAAAPESLARPLARTMPLRMILGARVVGWK